MRILVTGGAGFIGSHLVDALIEQGHEVVVLDDLSNGKREFIAGLEENPRFRFVQGSILDRPLVRQLLAECEIVYHLAAVLGVKNTVENPLKVIEGNIDGTRNILEIAWENRVKVIFASTSEIYGKNNELPFTEQSDRVLGPPHIHRWCYATAKALDEHICFAYADKGLPVTIVRFFNTYGPRQTSTQYGGVVPKFIVAALGRHDITVYGSGEQTRCFTFIDDVIGGLLPCMDPAFDKHAFNIGTTYRLTINELAAQIKRLTDSASSIVHIPYEAAYGPGYEDMQNRLPDISKAEGMLGYSPRTNMEQGLSKTIAWYKDNEGWRSA
ncbi:NAD-dependent epimerase/dehydratase family protein [Cohnella faecalis]|uniref:NAD-dependent epimerase/dehydratase family protein n=1 Tax=Cohnella faecalis TaxID=2315694 RepID=A0A398CNB6_9BACL|nr:NAD-dependent epimerase/dehydratase family protein [Cohnella faecalis]RIE04103.1 NAD-dependent epimerase/dehydratase family protein [Cohnella faecalis]